MKFLFIPQLFYFSLHKPIIVVRRWWLSEKHMYEKLIKCDNHM